MNDKSSQGKYPSFNFFCKNVKGNSTHLTQKNSRPGAKINTIFRLSKKYFKCIIIKTF